MTRIVSDAFREPPGTLPKIEHNAAVDMEAVILAAEIIAYLLQSHGEKSCVAGVAGFVGLICSYFRGKSGDTPSKTSLKEAARISVAFQRVVDCCGVGKAVPKNNIFLPIEAAYNAIHDLTLTGDPDIDWIAVRKFLDVADCKRESLSQNWRNTGRYSDALEIVRQAFIQEHFSTNTKPESGVVVMNMHKAKGKQFDEVIIFEGWPRIAKRKIMANPDRIVRGNMRDNVNDQARQNFRVSITRAKRRTTILTPIGDPCILLIPENNG
jgi:DNA helicase-2/ATP-dependent DNA helicase PcrA